MNIDTRHDADRTYFDSITARIPMGEWGTPDHFKGPAVFLASDASAYISGNIMVVRFLLWPVLPLFLLYEVLKLTKY